jgi:hypothetical protein
VCLRTGEENLTSTGIRSPDRPACSESLYRLRYCGPHFTHIHIQYIYILADLGEFGTSGLHTVLLDTWKFRGKSALGRLCFGCGL